MSARRGIIPVFVPHRGCPNNCVFCSQRRISGSLRPAEPRDVQNAIEQAAALPPVGTRRQLAFYGGSFTAIPAQEQEALLEAARPYLEAGVLDSLRVSTRPDAVDEERLLRLKRGGVGTVELGAQSMCDEVLRLSGRGHTAGDVERAARQVKAAGFELILQMMTGLPGATDERDADTALRLAALAPDGVRIYPTVILRGTPLYDLWRAGRYREHTVEDAVRVCARILPIFREAGIPVIRLGLNPTDTLSGGDAAAGAYHPALGELVRSRVLLLQALALLKDTPPGSDVVLGVRSGLVSQLTGQRGCNKKTLCGELSLRSLAVRGTEDEDDEVRILSVAKPEIL